VLSGGVALLLGVTALQTFDSDQVAAGYVGVLVVESVAGAVAGLTLRSRVLVVGGGAGAAFGALRALLIVSHLVPLYLVFGGVALILLAGSALLAVTRQGSGTLRADLGKAWQGWEL
jgi:hypothetical protein